MHYLVHAVGAHELPEGMDHLIVERDNGDPPVLLIAGGPAAVWTWMRAWEDEQESARLPTTLRPLPRQRGRVDFQHMTSHERHLRPAETA